MAKKSKALVPKGKAVVSADVTPSGIKDIQAAAVETPSISGADIPEDIRSIIQDPFMDLATKRRKVLELRGAAPKKKKKYKSPEARKAAAKERAAARKAQRVSELAPFGLEPKKREKMTEAERKARRSQRGKAKRAFLKEAAKEFPDLAQKHGLRFRKI